MTILNRGRNAAAEGVAGAAATERELRRCAASRRRFPARRFWIPLLTGLLIAAAADALASGANARGGGGSSGAGGGSSGAGGGSSGAGGGSAGRATSHAAPFTGLRTPRFDFRRDRFFADEGRGRFGEFRRFRRRGRDEFGDGFFPFGDLSDFGGPYWPYSPYAQSDIAAGNLSDGVAFPDPPFQSRFRPYEPPTIETTPSGVTIIRGPGSHRLPP